MNASRPRRKWCVFQCLHTSIISLLVACWPLRKQRRGVSRVSTALCAREYLVVLKSRWLNAIRACIGRIYPLLVNAKPLDYGGTIEASTRFTVYASREAHATQWRHGESTGSVVDLLQRCFIPAASLLRRHEAGSVLPAPMAIPNDFTFANELRRRRCAVVVCLTEHAVQYAWCINTRISGQNALLIRLIDAVVDYERHYCIKFTCDCVHTRTTIAKHHGTA